MLDTSYYTRMGRSTAFALRLSAALAMRKRAGLAKGVGSRGRQPARHAANDRAERRAATAWASPLLFLAAPCLMQNAERVLTRCTPLSATFSDETIMSSNGAAYPI